MAVSLPAQLRKLIPNLGETTSTEGDAVSGHEVRPTVGYLVLKRMMDITLCLLVLPSFLPIMAVCALAIKFDSPGPVIFVQERIGRGGRLFRMYKFRTLVSNADPSVLQANFTAFIEGQVKTSDPTGGAYKLTKDPRVTRIGRILRKTSLDELPQLVNVLKGDMSLIGPRPALRYEVELYPEHYKRRFQAIPGITGLWQVKGRSKVSFDEMASMDLEYIEHQSLWLDIKILLLTLRATITGRGTM